MEQKSIEYKASGITMEGYYARQDSSAAQPLVLVVHDWSGNREFAQEKARFFAELGYVGFAVDLYGKGKRGSDTDKELNQQLLGELLNDRKVIVPRLQAAIDCALALGNVNDQRILVIGFCMGGLCALDFARSGANVSGVISVHGILTAPAYSLNNKITAKILALHGNEDKMVSAQNVLDFEKEMTAQQVDWQMHIFSNTMHAFTNPKANDVGMGIKYNQLNDKRTWGIVELFAAEVLI